MHPSDPRRDTRERVRKLHEAGLTASEIAAVLKITRQRVYQLLKDAKAEKVAS